MEGGDYSTSSVYTASIDTDRKLITVDVSGYVDDVNSGSIVDNGLILIADNGEDEIHAMGLYAKDTKSGLYPYVSITYDDSVFVTGSATDSATEFTGSYLSKPYEFISYNHKNKLQSGDTFICQVDIQETFRRRSLNYDSRSKYVSGDVYYRLVDKTRGRVYMDYNDKNKISLNDYSMYVQIDTTNMPDAVYTIELKYTDTEDITLKQELTDFIIDD